jgi:hypothetical protein
MTLAEWAWDGVQQTLFAQWEEADGPVLRARLGYQSVTPGAVDALARALAGEWGAVHAIAGPVSCEGGGVVIQPTGVLTDQRAIILALEPRAPHPMPLREMPVGADPGQALLRMTFTLLEQVLRQGLRHMPPSLHRRALTQAAELDEAGYAEVARLLRTALADQRDADRLATLSALGSLLRALLNQGA